MGGEADEIVQLYLLPQMKRSQLHKDDYKYLQEKPDGDPDFNLERNNEIIERTIMKNDIVRRSRQKEFIDKLLERADAAASYLKAVDKKPFLTPEQYFSKDELTHLAGRRIVNKIAQEFVKRNAKA